MIALIAAVTLWRFFRSLKPFEESGRPADAAPPAVGGRSRGLSKIKEDMRPAC